MLTDDINYSNSFSKFLKATSNCKISQKTLEWGTLRVQIPYTISHNLNKICSPFVLCLYAHFIFRFVIYLIDGKQF